MLLPISQSKMIPTGGFACPANCIAFTPVAAILHLCLEWLQYANRQYQSN
jgi:hypothetical protein